MPEEQPQSEHPELKTEHVESYRGHHKDLYERMIRLHHNIQIMRHIDGFHWDPFVPADDQIFWNTTMMGLGDSTVLLFHGLLNDNSQDHLSLSRFKNLVRQWLKAEHVLAYNEACGTHRVDTLVEDALAKIRDLRHGFIAHRLRVGDQSAQRPQIVWTEVDAVFAHTKKVFDTVSLGTQCILALPGYGVPTFGREQKPDIDELLNGVAARSSVVNMPEKNPDLWAVLRPRKSEEYLTKLNELRKRAGLPPAT